MIEDGGNTAVGRNTPMYDDPSYYGPEYKAELAKSTKLRAALKALLATIPLCTYTVHDTETGADTDCKEPATATLNGPHDLSWEMCEAHAIRVMNEQPHPHRYQVSSRGDLIAAVKLAKEALGL